MLWSQVRTCCQGRSQDTWYQDNEIEAKKPQQPFNAHPDHPDQNSWQQWCQQKITPLQIRWGRLQYWPWTLSAHNQFRWRGSRWVGWWCVQHEQYLMLFDSRLPKGKLQIIVFVLLFFLSNLILFALHFLSSKEVQKLTLLKRGASRRFQREISSAWLSRTSAHSWLEFTMEYQLGCINILMLSPRCRSLSSGHFNCVLQLIDSDNFRWLMRLWPLIERHVTTRESWFRLTNGMPSSFWMRS